MPRFLRRTLFHPSFFFAFLITSLIISVFAFAPDTVSVLSSVVLRSTPRPLVLAPQTSTGCFYQVRQGDNLFRIGLRYGVSFRYLASLNGIPNPNLIYAGALLAVPCGANPQPIPQPTNCGPPETYVVQPGNNLFRIALAYGSRVEWIRAENNLYGRVLRPNMQLTIPCPGTVNYGPVPEPPPGVATVSPIVGQTVTAATPGPATETPGPTTAPSTPPPTNSVTVRVFADHFEPNTLTIAAGENVAWINQDSNQRVITCMGCAPNSLFDSADNSHTIPPGQIYQYTFTTVGTYDIVLQDNANIIISITVTPALNTPAP